jgi:hypothetical protein
VLAVGCYLAEPEHIDIKKKYGEVPGFEFEFDDYTQVTEGSGRPWRVRLARVAWLAGD